jgi:hypothetical protein
MQVEDAKEKFRFTSPMKRSFQMIMNTSLTAREAEDDPVN